jgi:hypothetical protein
MMTDHYRSKLRYPISRAAYDVVWRVLYVLSLPLRPVAWLIVWGYDRWADRRG